VETQQRPAYELGEFSARRHQAGGSNEDACSVTLGKGRDGCGKPFNIRANKERSERQDRTLRTAGRCLLAPVRSCCPRRLMRGPLGPTQ